MEKIGKMPNKNFVLFKKQRKNNKKSDIGTYEKYINMNFYEKPSN